MLSQKQTFDSCLDLQLVDFIRIYHEGIMRLKQLLTLKIKATTTFCLVIKADKV